MAKAKVVIPEPAPTAVTLELTFDEARWVMAVARHVNYSGRGGCDLSIYNALSDGGMPDMSSSESREILRHYDTDYGVFLGDGEDD